MAVAVAMRLFYGYNNTTLLAINRAQSQKALLLVFPELLDYVVAMSHFCLIEHPQTAESQSHTLPHRPNPKHCCGYFNCYVYSWYIHKVILYPKDQTIGITREQGVLSFLAVPCWCGLWRWCGWKWCLAAIRSSYWCSPDYAAASARESPGLANPLTCGTCGTKRCQGDSLLAAFQQPRLHCLTLLTWIEGVDGRGQVCSTAFLKNKINCSI